MGVKESVSSIYMEMQKQLHKDALQAHPKNRSALITGTENPGSIGAAIAERLRRKRWQVINPSSNDLDVRSAADARFFFGADTLILSHGVTELNWFEDSQAYEQIVAVNLIGSMRMAQQFINVSIDEPWRKTIVFIGSMAYRNALNGSAAYCASKAGLAMFARCLAWELAPKGFDVFCVHPSNTEGTPMTEQTIRGLMDYRCLTREDAEAYWGASLPRAKWLQTKDIARTVHWLITKGEYVSGAQIELGGGQR
jgi:NAD(P)-dependent dehydrogenase (short-subunit alcohol dehydrogenase family)